MSQSEKSLQYSLWHTWTLGGKNVCTNQVLGANSVLFAAYSVSFPAHPSQVYVL